MNIGIISAIKQETEILKKIIYINREKKINNFKISIGKFNNHNIFLIKSGIGKVCASMSAMILLNLYQIDIIINSGSAGSLNSSLKIGDIILPEKTCYYDVDLKNFGYAKGQIPKYPEKFIVNTQLIKFFEKNIEHKWKFNTGLIISGDSFVRKNSDIIKFTNHFFSAIAVEMESAAIAQVCYKHNMPLIIVKSISDLSDGNATLNFKENVSIASFQCAKFVKKILENINFIYYIQ